MSAPSFFCERETPDGLLLHYRSSRRGFVHYVIGQIRHVASNLYNQHVDIDIISETELQSLPPLPSLIDVALHLRFDNSNYKAADQATDQELVEQPFHGFDSTILDHKSPTFQFGACPMACPMITTQSMCPVSHITNGNKLAYKYDDDEKSNLDFGNCNLAPTQSPVDNPRKVSDNSSQSNNMKVVSETFLEGFPFHLLFDNGLKIRHVGSALDAVLSNLIGRSISEAFTLMRPLVPFTIDNVRIAGLPNSNSTESITYR